METADAELVRADRPAESRPRSAITDAAVQPWQSLAEMIQSRANASAFAVNDVARVVT